MVQPYFPICLCCRQKKLEQMMEEEGLKDEEVMNMGKIILMVKYK